MKMADWVEKLDQFLKLSERKLLANAGSISAEQAAQKAEKEFETRGKYIVACRVQDNLGGEAIKTKEFQIDG